MPDSPSRAAVYAPTRPPPEPATMTSVSSRQVVTPSLWMTSIPPSRESEEHSVMSHRIKDGRDMTLQADTDEIRQIEAEAAPSRFARGWHCLGLTRDLGDGPRTPA